MTTSMRAESSSERITSTSWTSTIELRQLRVFLAVVEHGGVGAAGMALGLAQSTVSEALAGLDRAAGMPVLRRRRGAQAITLTEAGSALLPHARRILQEVDALHRSVAKVTRAAKAHVQIFANESVSTYILAPVLSTLRRRWPQVRFVVNVGTCAIVRDAVTSGRSDLGLLLEEVSDPQAVGVRQPSATSVTIVPDVPLVIFARRDHPAFSQRRPTRTEDLTAWPLYISDSAGDFHDLVRRFFTSEGLPGPLLDAVGSIESVKRAVIGEVMAMGLLPSYAVAEEVRSGLVRELSLHPPAPRMRLVALLPSPRGNVHPAVQDLLTAFTPI